MVSEDGSLDSSDLPAKSSSGSTTSSVVLISYGAPSCAAISCIRRFRTRQAVAVLSRKGVLRSFPGSVVKRTDPGR